MSGYIAAGVCAYCMIILLVHAAALAKYPMGASNAVTRSILVRELLCVVGEHPVSKPRPLAHQCRCLLALQQVLLECIC
jgi:hypothetical protein